MEQLLIKFYRYYGVNDPVAEKLMRRAETMPKLEPPEDKTVTTLYVGNVSDRITEKELQDHFYQYGEIRSITVLAKQQCAFIQFTTRSAAELAAERTFNKLILCGRRMTIRWGRSQGRQNPSLEEGEVDLEPVPGLPGALPLPPEEVASNFAGVSQNIPFPPGMPPPFLLPPPMPRPPPGMRPSAPPLFFFPSHLRPPLAPPPSVQPSTFTQRPSTYPAATVSVLSRVPADPGAPGTMPATGIHYPSQDPSRLGTTKKSWAPED